MNYVGIDPGTWCGWAVLNAGGERLASGVWDLRPKSHEGGGFRYVRLTGYLGTLLAAYSNVRVGYEDVRRHLGVDAAHMYGGIVATLQRVCEERHVPYVAVHFAAIKRAATGKGNAKKDAMIAAAAARWPELRQRQDDEADALWVAETLRLRLEPESEGPLFAAGGNRG